MANPRTDLEGNADFIADLLSDMTRDSIVEKWNTSAGYVSSRREAIRRGNLQLPTSPSPEAPPETTEITTNDDGTKKFTMTRNGHVDLEDARKLVRSTGDDPDLYNYAIRTIAYGAGLWSNKISVWPKHGVDIVAKLPLKELYSAVKRRRSTERPVPRAAERGTVIVVSDLQIGKTGRRGGTPELLQRLADAREKLEVELTKRAPGQILLLDGGDGIEGFESGGNPMFTNDLSLPDQIDCYSRELFSFVDLANSHAPVDVAMVCSNHASWRHAKQNLGLPKDDWGIHVHKRLENEISRIEEMDVVFHFPDDYDESICVDFMGTPIGLVHGNQFSPGKAIDWWQGQTFGDQAVTRADVLVTGHYHSFGAGVAGQNPHTKRERMWLGAPTMDSGSDWYRNIRGRDSLPGVMIFDVGPDGFDLASLAIL